MGFSNRVVGGAAALIRAAVKSPNYLPGTAGWSVNKDGTAEFNNLTVRGTFAGLTFIINSSGAFFYSGTPANGNLVASIASAAGTDGFGNGYGAGVESYGGFGAAAQMMSGSIGLFSGVNVICQLTPNGFFLYSPSGGLGNLIGSWATAAGTDTYGNAYPKGLNVTTGQITGSTIIGALIESAATGRRTTIDANGDIKVYNASGAVLAWFVNADDAQFFYADTGTATQGRLICSIANVAGTDPFANAYRAGVTSYAAGGSWIELADANLAFGDATGGFTNLYASRSGPAAIGAGYLLAAADPAGPAFETWHYVGAAGQPAFANTWGNNGNNLAFRFLPDGNVQIVGANSSGAGPVGTTVFTLPTAYRPAKTSYLYAFNATTGGGAFLQVLNTGAVVVGGTGLAANQTWVMSGTFDPAKTP